MISYPAPVQAALAGRDALMVRHLVWMSARNRDSGAIEAIAIWDGDDHQAITIGGEERTYYGAGAMLGLPDLTFESGLKVRAQTIKVSGVSPEIEVALRGYDPKGAPVEIHQWFLDPLSGNQLAAPLRVYKGFIDTVTIPTARAGGDPAATIRLVSAARALTRTVPLRRSDAASQQRGGDRFYRYSDISGTVKVKLGA